MLSVKKDCLFDCPRQKAKWFKNSYVSSKSAAIESTFRKQTTDNRDITTTLCWHENVLDKEDLVRKEDFTNFTNNDCHHIFPIEKGKKGK